MAQLLLGVILDGGLDALFGILNATEVRKAWSRSHVDTQPATSLYTQSPGSLKLWVVDKRSLRASAIGAARQPRQIAAKSCAGDIIGAVLLQLRNPYPNYNELQCPNVPGSV